MLKAHLYHIANRLVINKNTGVATAGLLSLFIFVFRVIVFIELLVVFNSSDILEDKS